KFDVAYVIAAEVDVHQARHGVLRRCVAVVVHALDKRGGAVAYPDDGHADFAIEMTVLVIGAHAPTSSRTLRLDVMPSISSRRSRKRRMFSRSSEQSTWRASRRVGFMPSPRR